MSSGRLSVDFWNAGLHLPCASVEENLSTTCSRKAISAKHFGRKSSITDVTAERACTSQPQASQVVDEPFHQR